MIQADRDSHNKVPAIEEISIKVPWGHLACKWWGPKNVRPIVALHGWQDNAGTFDRLIPLLPTDMSYLAVDLPGHGLSSWLPDGIYYTTFHNVYALIYLVEHFKWNKISLMGHSMGGIISFLYASQLLDACDFVITLDALLPPIWEPATEVKVKEVLLRENFKLDLRNQSDSLPPTYTYETALEILCSIEGDMKLTREAAPCLLKRGLNPSVTDNSRFYFTRDTRLKYQMADVFSIEKCIAYARRINIPFCYIRALTAKIDKRKNDKDNVLRVLKKNKHFEMHNVAGMHFVHLNEPETIAGILIDFINKYHYLRTPASHL